MSQINWITNKIRYVCEKFKCRSAGSQADNDCQSHFTSELNGWADEVKKESFTLHPKAFVGCIALESLFALGSAVFFWLSLAMPQAVAQALCFLFGFLAFFCWLFEYVLYREVTDVFYPKKTAHNVYACIKPKGKVKKRIILSGHSDAAYEMPFFVKLSMAANVVMIALGEIGILLCLVGGIAQLYMTVGSAGWIALGVVESLFVLELLAFEFFVNWKVVVDGANDNLTGCMIAMSILKEMKEKDFRFENTEVCCLITSGEESGLRGALAFAKSHKKELQETETAVIAIDTIHEEDQLMVYDRGINGTQKNSREVCELLRKAGRNKGKELPYAGFYPGATDAEAFSRHGIKAAAICAVRHSPMPYYHTRKDSWDNLDPDCIRLTREICMEAVRLFAGEETA